MQWSKANTSSKIEIESDGVTIISKDGGGFKSSLADFVKDNNII